MYRPSKRCSSPSPRTAAALADVYKRQWLRYKSFPVNVALIRATYCDEDGNATMDKEAATLDSLAIAQAAKNSGGIVLLQVEKVVQNLSLIHI